VKPNLYYKTYEPFALKRLSKAVYKYLLYRGILYYNLTMFVLLAELVVMNINVTKLHL
jgi:hypothetical protein